MQVPVEGKLVPAAEYYRDHLKEFQRDMHRYAATLDAFDNLNNITESQKQDAADIKATGRQADFDAETRKAHRAFDRALFTQAIVDAHAKNEEIFRRSYGGVNLAKAKLTIHLGAPVNFTAPPELVNTFKSAKRHTFEIISLGTPFTLR